MEILYKDSNRLARINILFDMLREHREMVGALMALLVPLQVEPYESGRGMTYIVACDAKVPLFEELAEGEEIPEYRIVWAFDGAFPEPEREARRVSSGKFGFVAIRNTIVRVPAVAMAIQVRNTQRLPH